MELRETEALGVFDHDDGGVRHVDADFDHGGGDEDLCFAGAKGVDGCIFLGRLHLAVDQADLAREGVVQDVEALLGGGEVKHLVLFHQRADPEGLVAGWQRGVQAVDDLVHACGRDSARCDRLAARGFFGEARHVEVAIGGHCERARDGRCRHHEDVGGTAALAGECKALVDAETVLLVDDHKAEVVVGDAFRDQRVRADQDVQLAVGELFERAVARRAPVAAGHDGD